MGKKKGRNHSTLTAIWGTAKHRSHNKREQFTP